MGISRATPTVLRIGTLCAPSIAVAIAASAGPVFPEIRLPMPNAEPSDGAAGDFDGDGHLDLAIANRDRAPGLVLYRGNGDGTFDAWASFDDIDAVEAVRAHDMNGDGIADLVAAGSDSLHILLNVGDGRFQQHTVRNAGSDVRPAIEDFNSDSLLDIAVLDGSFVYVVVATDAGEYELASGFSAGSRVEHIQAADFNADGIADLAVSIHQSDGQVAIRLGSGDATFQEQLLFPVGSNPTALVVHDVNGDGIPDLVVGVDDGVSILTGVGDGTFNTIKVLAFSQGHEKSLAIGDIDGDGIADLAVLEVDGNSMLHVLSGRDGEFRHEYSVEFDRGSFSPAASGDFDGNGRMDHAIPDWEDEETRIVLAREDGRLHVAQNVLPRNFRVRLLELGDMNGDGIPDLFTHKVDFPDISVLLGNGDRTFGEPSELQLGPLSFSASHLADLDGDGDLDALLAHRSSTGSIKDQVTLPFMLALLGNGDGTLEEGARLFPARNIWNIETADLNRDGVLDAVLFGETLSVSLGNGDGTFQDELVHGPIDSSSLVALGDFNEDDAIDVVARALPADAAIFFGDGDGTFAEREFVEVGEFVRGLDVRDINRDGHDDIVVADTRGISVRLGNGDGTFEESVVSELDCEQGPFIITDLDGDGREDLAMRFADEWNWLLLRGIGDGTFVRFSDGLVRATRLGNAPIAGDLDGDGDQDLIDFGSSMEVLVFENLAVTGCRADLDGDGDADAEDFFAYLDAFANGDLGTCDIDTDGDCDAEDFFGYLDRFAQGC